MYDRETAKKLQVTMAAGTDDQTHEFVRIV